MSETVNKTGIRSPSEIQVDIQRSFPTQEPSINNEGEYLDLQLERDIRREYLITLRNNNLARMNYARKTFVLTVIWIIVVLAIVLFNGFDRVHLSDTVLVTLISTTTINVFAFFLLVIKYLFHPPKVDKDLQK